MVWRRRCSVSRIQREPPCPVVGCEDRRADSQFASHLREVLEVPTETFQWEATVLSRRDPNPYADTTSAPENLLFREVEYRIEQTRFGEWRGFMYEDRTAYHEFTSHAKVAGIPLVHYTQGKCPETGRRKVARGVIAVGRIAVGFLAVGQASLGMIGVGQATFGFLFGLGQLALGGTAIGQGAIGAAFALGQFAVGYLAVGQLAAGVHATGMLVWELLW